jgi:hypothetical protein
MVQRGTERLMLMRVILPRDRLGAARALITSGPLFVTGG